MQVSGSTLFYVRNPSSDLQLSLWNIQKGKLASFGDSSVKKTKALRLPTGKNKADPDILKQRVLKQSDLISWWLNINSLKRTQ